METDYETLSQTEFELSVKNYAIFQLFGSSQSAIDRGDDGLA
jgi:hypothetical protein